MTGEGHQSRWNISRRYLRGAWVAFKAGDLERSLCLFTQAHDLGDDNTSCHGRAHLGRALIELRQHRVHDAAVDLMLAMLAVLSSPPRRLRGVRGSGYGT